MTNIKLDRLEWVENLVEDAKPENSLIIYGHKPDGKYDEPDYSAHKNGSGRAGASAIGYGFGELVEKVETSIVKKKDDPLYQASSSIANRLVNDRTFGSIVAIGIYCALKEFIGPEKKGK